MNYRGMQDRRVSVYIAVLIITIFGAGMTSVILRVVSTVNYSETNLAQIEF